MRTYGIILFIIAMVLIAISAVLISLSPIQEHIGHCYDENNNEMIGIECIVEERVIQPFVYVILISGFALEFISLFLILHNREVYY